MQTMLQNKEDRKFGANQQWSDLQENYVIYLTAHFYRA